MCLSFLDEVDPADGLKTHPSEDLGGQGLEDDDVGDIYHKKVSWLLSL